LADPGSRRGKVKARGHRIPDRPGGAVRQGIGKDHGESRVDHRTTDADKTRIGAGRQRGLHFVENVLGRINARHGPSVGPVSLDRGIDRGDVRLQFGDADVLEGILMPEESHGGKKSDDRDGDQDFQQRKRAVLVEGTHQGRVKNTIITKIISLGDAVSNDPFCFMGLLVRRGD
jgi:hypothetical protein